MLSIYNNLNIYEDIYKWCHWQGINFQDIQIAYTTQKRKKKIQSKKCVEHLNRHCFKEDI